MFSIYLWIYFSQWATPLVACWFHTRVWSQDIRDVPSDTFSGLKFTCGVPETQRPVVHLRSRYLIEELKAASVFRPLELMSPTQGIWIVIFICPIWMRIKTNRTFVRGIDSITFRFLQCPGVVAQICFSCWKNYLSPKKSTQLVGVFDSDALLDLSVKEAICDAYSSSTRRGIKGRDVPRMVQGSGSGVASQKFWEGQKFWRVQIFWF